MTMIALVLAVIYCFIGAGKVKIPLAGGTFVRGYVSQSALFLLCAQQ
jgi:hypothetical protein